MHAEEFIAHINSEGNVQSIEEHLKGTAERSGQYAQEFGCGEAGYLCGAFHDLGKYSAEFQRRIRNPEHTARTDHSTAGAKVLVERSRNYIPIAMAVAGHHSGLLDGGSPRVAAGGSFYGRLKTEIPDYSEWKKNEALYRQWNSLDASGGACFPKFCAESKFSMAFLFA